MITPFYKERLKSPEMEVEPNSKTMLLRLFKHIVVCVSKVLQKGMPFGESDTNATTYLEGKTRLGGKKQSPEVPMCHKVS